MELEQAVDAEDRFCLGIGAVQLDVTEGPLGLFTALLDPGREVGLAATQGQRLQRPLGSLEHPGGLAELVLHPAPARERPFRDHDRLALVVGQGCSENQSWHKVDQLPVAQRVAGAGGGVHHVRAGQRAPGGHRQDGRHHQVDRDDVDDPFRDARGTPSAGLGRS